MPFSIAVFLPDAHQIEGDWAFAVANTVRVEQEIFQFIGAGHWDLGSWAQERAAMAGLAIDLNNAVCKSRSSFTKTSLLMCTKLASPN